MDEIKKTFKDDYKLPKGTYFNENHDILTISEADKKSDIDPNEFYNILKKAKKLDLFWTSISVSIKEAEKVLGKDEIEKLRTVVGTTTRYVFK